VNNDLSRVHYKRFIIATYLIFFAVIIFLYMKTLIEINRSLWGKVKDYATVNELNLYSAVERLLAQALISNGYSLRP
jgi:hypothetical protein